MIKRPKTATAREAVKQWRAAWPELAELELRAFSTATVSVENTQNLPRVSTYHLLGTRISIEWANVSDQHLKDFRAQLKNFTIGPASAPSDAVKALQDVTAELVRRRQENRLPLT